MAGLLVLFPWQARQTKREGPSHPDGLQEASSGDLHSGASEVAAFLYRFGPVVGGTL